MRGTLTFGGLIVVILIIGMLAKKQLSTPIYITPAGLQTSSGSTQGHIQGSTQQVLTKPADISKQVQQELNNAANKAAKRLEQVEGKQ